MVVVVVVVVEVLVVMVVVVVVDPGGRVVKSPIQVWAEGVSPSLQALV